MANFLILEKMCQSFCESQNAPKFMGCDLEISDESGRADCTKCEAAYGYGVGLKAALVSLFKFYQGNSMLKAILNR